MVEIDISKLLEDPAQAKQSADKRQFIFSEIIVPGDQSKKPYQHRTSSNQSRNWRSLNAEISLSWVHDCPKDLLFCDLGSGPLTNEDVFKERKVVYVDGAAYSGVNVVTDFRGPLPFKDQVFDRIHCSNVLEHLSNPSLALQEIHRILRPGGEALILVPFVIKEHQMPHDFFRYTSSALKKLADDAGLSIINIRGIGGLGNIKATISRLEKKYLTSWRQKILLKAEDFILRIRVNEYGDIDAPELPQGWVVMLKRKPIAGVEQPK